MILLTATTHTLELVTAYAVATEWTAHYADHTTSAFTPGSDQGVVSTATDSTIVGAPGGSTQRQIKLLTIRNAGTSDQIVTIQKDVSGTEYRISPDITLAAGEVLEFIDGQGFRVLDPFGQPKTSAEAEVTNIGDALNPTPVSDQRCKNLLEQILFELMELNGKV